MSYVCPDCGRGLDKVFDASTHCLHAGLHHAYLCGSRWYLPIRGETVAVVSSDHPRTVGTQMPPTKIVPPAWTRLRDGEQCLQNQRNQLQAEIERLWAVLVAAKALRELEKDYGGSEIGAKWWSEMRLRRWQLDDAIKAAEAVEGGKK